MHIAVEAEVVVRALHALRGSGINRPQGVTEMLNLQGAIEDVREKPHANNVRRPIG
jgi:hypothetical protein